MGMRDKAQQKHFRDNLASVTLTPILKFFYFFPFFPLLKKKQKKKKKIKDLICNSFYTDAAYYLQIDAF